MRETLSPAANQIAAGERAAKAVLAVGDCVDLKHLAVKGADLIAAGVKPGKELGEILQAMLEWVLENPGMNDKDELLRQLKERS